MEDAQGASFKWFASGYQNIEPGNKLILTGTVKAHTEREGRKTTQLTRCTWEMV